MSPCRQHVKSLVSIQKRYCSSARDYNGAVAALNGLQSNFSVVEAIRKLGPGANKRSLPDMVNWVRRIGYEVRHVRLITKRVNCLTIMSAVRIRPAQSNPYCGHQRQRLNLVLHILYYSTVSSNKAKHTC